MGDGYGGPGQRPRDRCKGRREACGPQMRGHVRRRSPGTWAIVLDIREDGRRRRKWHSFKGTKREAEAECARLIAMLKSGSYMEPTKTTVASFLEHWLAHKRMEISPRTHECYGEVVRNIVPTVGNIVLSKLQPAIIAQMYSQALQRLSPRSVHMMHRLLSQALKQAVTWQLLPRNPCDAVATPRVERKRMQA